MYARVVFGLGTMVESYLFYGGHFVPTFSGGNCDVSTAISLTNALSRNFIWVGLGVSGLQHFLSFHLFVFFVKCGVNGNGKGKKS